MVYLFAKKNRKNQLLRLPILYFLFAFYILGVAAGITVIDTCSMDAFVSVGQGSLGTVVLSNMVYFAGIVLLGRIWLGFLAIPIVLFCKGFTLSAAVCVMMRIAEVEPMRIIMRIGIPTALQMSGLFYVSSAVFLLSVKRLLGISFGKEDANGLKRGLLVAAISSVLSVVSACVVYSI